ncbi:helix-turn-helix domain-containing protein [Botrimarina mediterranea]|uniref:Helix-turn-helix domain protein n=1 Tax=Botrimarina mediterranea TaxID=2528022 RepID=A0A518KD25_9BACT|nr:helix-turn-helix domain-containing protein [Botrimarina mediterranea]QDV75701.1 Helix-turn-helix domain protein [Botrimarina mediterranea]
MLTQPRSRSEHPSDVLTLSEAAHLLKVCDKTLAGLAKSGDLPARRVGNQWRFSRLAVLAFLEGGPANPPEEAMPTAADSGKSQTSPSRSARPTAADWRRRSGL